MLSNSTVQLCILIFLWYLISSLANIVGKRLLTIFPHPISVTLAQLFHGWAYSIPLLRLINIPQPTYLYSTRIYYISIIIPLAIGKLFSQLTSQISLRLVPVSYTHTVKALMPIFTVVLSRIILSEEQSFMTYISLIPIIVGVIIASLSELSFDAIGLISALFSTGLLAIQNIYSKKTLQHIDIHHLALLSILSKFAWCLLIPFWFLFDGPQIDIRQELTLTVIFFMLIDGLCNFIYNVLAFTMISRLSPLSYVIAGSTKRLVVIIISILILHNPVTKMNLFGISLALVGVVLYNKIKYDEKKQQSLLKTITVQSILPSPVP
ncbi:unnamed protein product [Adineta steineri]|uniref:Sugar phosphate transporter domain-containing protein n=1 Tax=Adineta steineri TaxID=433720 RepID=A0A813SDE7_9BILA|nr:unnamed protein product [Adineta steineri]CAF3545937.1 unnamed protein product [Adineta steineri]